MNSERLHNCIHDEYEIRKFLMLVTVDNFKFVQIYYSTKTEQTPFPEGKQESALTFSQIVFSNGRLSNAWWQTYRVNLHRLRSPEHSHNSENNGFTR